MPYLRVTKTPFVRRTPLRMYLCLPHLYELESFSSMMEIDEPAEELLKLCDGTRTRDDILRQLSEASGEPVAEFASDFDGLVEYLVGEGVLEWEEEPSFVEPLYNGNKPFGIFISITLACNLNCSFCAVCTGKACKDNMASDDVDNIIEQVKKCKPTPVSITGGEPTIKKKTLLHIVEELTPIKEIDVNVFTNGTLITKDYAQQLYDAGLRIARVSIDGHTAQLHDTIRGKKGAFEKTVEGIKYLRDLGIHVNTVTVICKMNYPYLKQIREFANQITDSFIITPVSPAGRAYGSDMLLDPEEMLGVMLSQFESGIIQTAITPLGSCMAGKTLYIAPNGDIFPCVQTQFPETKIGNIGEDDLSEIYKTEKLQNLLKSTVEDFEQCRDCDIRYFCGGGCRGFAYRFTGSLCGSDVFGCRMYKMMASTILENGEENTKKTLQDLIESTRALNV